MHRSLDDFANSIERRCNSRSSLCLSRLQGFNVYSCWGNIMRLYDLVLYTSPRKSDGVCRGYERDAPEKISQVRRSHHVGCWYDTHPDCSDHAISISFPEFIDDAALTFLLNNGLQQRCPGICPQFEHNRQEIKQAREHAIDQERSKLSHSSEAFRQDCLFTATVVLQKQVSQMYP